MKYNRKYGGAALEYIIVTLFSATIAVATTKIIKKVIERELARLEDELPGEDP